MKVSKPFESLSVDKPSRYRYLFGKKTFYIFGSVGFMSVCL